MKQWFAVRSKPRRERLVDTVLTQRGIQVFLPEISPLPTRGQASAGREPLFPGYLFTRLDLETSEWIAARCAPGVVSFLGAEGVPTALPDALIAKIQERIEQRARRAPEAPYRPGDRVIIAGGPFEGLEAVFDGTLSSSGRVRVFLDVVNRLVPVELSAAVLRSAGPVRLAG